MSSATTDPTNSRNWTSLTSTVTISDTGTTSSISSTILATRSPNFRRVQSAVSRWARVTSFGITNPAAPKATTMTATLTPSRTSGETNSPNTDSNRVTIPEICIPVTVTID